MRKSLIALAFLSSLTIASQANADQYGCTVLMCLSNAKGPMEERECVPPIKKFLDGQAKRPKDPFPSCPEGAPATMEEAYRIYDPCPEGTTPLASGSYAVQLTAEVYQQLFKPKSGYGPPVQFPPGTAIQSGIGDGSTESLGTARNLVCVGKSLGTFAWRSAFDSTNQAEMVLVTAFDQVTTIAPAASPYVIDVKINGKLFRSTRF